MQIADFAQQILFGDSLDDKLLHVDSVSSLRDDHTTPWRHAIPLPGRPDTLALDKPREKIPFPSLSALEDPTARGHVLHFFANHELLALELMALALLRFPDAPEGFRRGIVGTMLEEQEHLRLYLGQMKRAGVNPGDIPVNRYFWDCIASMDSPTDFVVRMSMTFEQANLDYAAYYAKAFATVGDQHTADILQHVFEDEIGHVQHGVTWFQRWRKPGESLFDAYCRHLPAPLTASRARGRTFHAAARRKAGLPQSFIESLQVFGASKGRPPAVHWFNPHCEAQIAHGAKYTPKAHAHALAQDLSILPLFFAGQDDVVLVPDKPTAPFLKSLHHAGLKLPQLLTCDPRAPIHIPHPHLGALHPWGWSPLAKRRAQHLSARTNHPDTQAWLDKDWNTKQRQLFAKTWAAEVLSDLLTNDTDWWSKPNTTGRTFQDANQALSHAQHLQQQGWPRTVIKAPWGTSGRNAIRIDQGVWAAGQQGWVQNTLRKQGSVLVEPWLDKVADLSLLLHVPAQSDPKIHGTTHFLTDQRGQYMGTWLTQATWPLSSEVRRWLTKDGKDPKRFPQAITTIAHHVSHKLQQEGFTGPAGIDMLIYKTATTFALKPIIEINPRRTMGHLTLHLKAHLDRGSIGLWTFIRASDLPTHANTLAQWASHAQAAYPLQTSQRKGKTVWTQGILCTNDPASAQQALSVALIATSKPQLHHMMHQLGINNISSQNE